MDRSWQEHARVAEGMAEAHREKVAAMSATIDALQAKVINSRSVWLLN